MLETAQRPQAMLCVDSETAAHPAWIGLPDEDLSAQRWLAVCTSAERARQAVRRGGWPEVWVVGSDSVDAVNLAAALKADARGTAVRLLSFDVNGSLLSRARVAGIDEVMDRASFLSRYAGMKPVNSAPRQQAGAWEAVRSDQPPSTSTFSEQGTAVMEGVQRSAQAPYTAPAASSMSGGSPANGGRRGSLLCVSGVAGGVGKSTVAVLLACIMQRSGRSTVLLDADFQFGDAHFLMGVDDPVRVDDLLRSRQTPLPRPSADGLPAVVACPERMERSEEASASLLHVVDVLRSAFDVVVVNMGAMWTDAHVRMMGASTSTLLLMDQRTSSVRRCKHALRLCSSCGVASQSFLLAVNRCSRGAMFTSIDVSCAIGGVQAVELREGGRDVSEVLGIGRPLELLESGNPLVESLERVAEEQLPPALAIGAPSSRSRRPRRSAGRPKKERRRRQCR